jgi:hypothetical protein
MWLNEVATDGRPIADRYATDTRPMADAGRGFGGISHDTTAPRSPAVARGAYSPSTGVLWVRVAKTRASRLPSGCGYKMWPAPENVADGSNGTRSQGCRRICDNVSKTQKALVYRHKSQDKHFRVSNRVTELLEMNLTTVPKSNQVGEQNRGGEPCQYVRGHGR